MRGDPDETPGFLDDEARPIPAREAGEPPEAALVIEDDPELIQVCARVLSRAGFLVSVITTRKAALAALARRGPPPAFVYADAQLLAGTCADAAAEIRRRRRETPFVLAGREIGDVLSCDGIVICRSFDQEQFQAAYDGSLVDEERRRLLLAAVEDDGAGDAAVVGARGAFCRSRRMQAVRVGA